MGITCNKWPLDGSQNTFHGVPGHLRPALPIQVGHMRSLASL